MRVALLALVLANMFVQTACAKSPQVCFSDACVDVSIMRTDAQLQRGLSGHAPLKKNEGMLFAFSKQGVYTFWMNEMLFNLDIVWINGQGKIVHIAENLSPCTPQDCPKYASKDKAQYVLEVPAGFTKDHRLKVGDSARLP